MAENLNYRIPESDSGWCAGNDIDSCAKYGRLYSWSTALRLDRRYDTVTPPGGSRANSICPAGWSIPTDLLYDTLATTFGGDPMARETAKFFRSSLGWGGAGIADPDTAAGVDSIGFRALPGGYSPQPHDDRFFATGVEAFFWTRDIWMRLLETEFGHLPLQRTWGGSLRCVQD